MFYNEGFSGRKVGGPPLQCQSRPSIAAKKRVNRQKTQIRDKTIEKYTSISSDGGGEVEEEEEGEWPLAQRCGQRNVAVTRWSCTVSDGTVSPAR